MMNRFLTGLAVTLILSSAVVEAKAETLEFQAARGLWALRAYSFQLEAGYCAENSSECDLLFSCGFKDNHRDCRTAWEKYRGKYEGFYPAWEIPE